MTQMTQTSSHFILKLNFTSSVVSQILLLVLVSFRYMYFLKYWSELFPRTLELYVPVHVHLRNYAIKQQMSVTSFEVEVIYTCPSCKIYLTHSQEPLRRKRCPPFSCRTTSGLPSSETETDFHLKQEQPTGHRLDFFETPLYIN